MNTEEATAHNKCFKKKTKILQPTVYSDDELWQQTDEYKLFYQHVNDPINSTRLGGKHESCPIRETMIEIWQIYESKYQCKCSTLIICEYIVKNY
jgi:hypothetical protein